MKSKLDIKATAKVTISYPHSSVKAVAVVLQVSDKSVRFTDLAPKFILFHIALFRLDVYKFEKSKTKKGLPSSQSKPTVSTVVL